MTNSADLVRSDLLELPREALWLLVVFPASAGFFLNAGHVKEMWAVPHPGAPCRHAGARPRIGRSTWRADARLIRVPQTFVQRGNFGNPGVSNWTVTQRPPLSSPH